MTYKKEERHRISDYWINMDPEEIEEYWVKEGAYNILYTSEGGRIPFRQCKSGAFKGKFFCRKKDITPEIEIGAIAFMLKAYFYAFLEDDLYNISNDDDFGIRLEWKYTSPQERTLQLLESCDIRDKHFKRHGGWRVTETGHMIYEPALFQPLPVDLWIRDVIYGSKVFRPSADQSRYRADDASADQHYAEYLLEEGRCRKPPHVKSEQEQRAYSADYHDYEMDVISHHAVEDRACLDPRDQISENVGDLDRLPGDYGDHASKRRPAGYESDLVVESLEGEGHPPSGDGEHRDEFCVTEAYRDHHYKYKEISERGGNGSTAGCHPAVDRNGPPDAYYGAEADAEEINCAYAPAIWFTIHNRPHF